MSIHEPLLHQDCCEEAILLAVRVRRDSEPACMCAGNEQYQHLDERFVHNY